MPEEENVTQTQIVRPIIKTKDALSDLRAFEELKTNLLSSSDFQAVSGRNFIKKSGWRKLALVFNISDQIIESKIKKLGEFPAGTEVGRRI